ncbi:hypothetical protein Bpfe_013577 [Biomphalaria pfeifferi]|uniref:Uncharacterized protein n=1 Tax=Biomphalaria pfeifferi TaxID=112525 RepID=A0AAD8BNK2_BIOPF|nr:hypothetical protein Bpfe_013577 [Biomphalaria pfeifferi]
MRHLAVFVFVAMATLFYTIWQKCLKVFPVWKVGGRVFHHGHNSVWLAGVDTDDGPQDGHQNCHDAESHEATTSYWHQSAYL